MVDDDGDGRRRASQVKWDHLSIQQFFFSPRLNSQQWKCFWPKVGKMFARSWKEKQIDTMGQDDGINERKKEMISVKLEWMVNWRNSVPCPHFLSISFTILFVFWIYCHRISGLESRGMEENIIKIFINLALEHFNTAFRKGIQVGEYGFCPVALVHYRYWWG